MSFSISQLKDKLVEKGLKVTPQRIAILEAIYVLGNHPTAEMIREYIKNSHPGISTATIYKVLDAFGENQLVRKVKTEKDIKRYDGVMDHHHHLYSSESEEIKDYFNTELDRLLEDFFERHKISDFEIEEIKIQINGKFLKPGKSK